MLDNHAFIRWFRGSSPYIHAHRGRTFVVCFGGEAVAEGACASLAHDFALLNSLGIRLVLVHGFRPQVEERLQLRGERPRYHNGLRVTDAQALLCAKEAAGLVRVEIEALLSMGVANSPMAGARVRVASGNFVIAKPVGVRDGVDFQHTGDVRRIDAEAIREKLDHGNVVLLSPIGYSPTGEAFNLSAEAVATAAAIALQADKLLLLIEQDGPRNADGQPARQLTTEEAQALLEQNAALSPQLAAHIQAALTACRSAVPRAHLIQRRLDGAMLLELFTRDGVGTLISSAPFEDLRRAGMHDVGGILELIAPLEASGVLVPRTRERLEMDIDDYTVIERDGTIIGCAALHAYPGQAMGEMACLALHPEYRGGQRGERLLAFVENQARSQGLAVLFVLTTQTEHWFRERGFIAAAVDELPPERRAGYNPARNSKVLIKRL
ncbi:MAG: amino-acid N-acetyltransferase [Methylococcaceae bacterium]|nr:MAG: amino-acid N-acetyltransferase [Methylococcaceae bacterium]